MSVYKCCSAIGLYLKSKLHLVDGGSKFEFTNEVVNMYTHLRKYFIPDKDIFQAVKLGEKYLSASQSPNMKTEFYTKEFAGEFLEYVDDVKNYVDSVNNSDTASEE